jgi:DNA-binding MarR family transcriptional regulator
LLIDGSAARSAASEDELTREIVTLMNGLMKRMWLRHVERVAEVGLSVSEAKVLLALEPGRTLSMGDVSAVLRVNPSNVTATVGRLVTRGLVRRQGADDRRVKGVVVTDEGATLRARLQSTLLVDSPAVRGLTREQRQALRGILRQLEAMAGVPGPD